MNSDSLGYLKVVTAVLLFPTFFQEDFLAFAWAANDPFWLMTIKRLFLLLPVLSFILACWVTIPSALSTIFRHNRREYIISLFTTWWDLGRSIVMYWGGFLKFVFQFIVGLLGMLKVLTLGLISILQSILFMPFRLLGNAGRKVTGSKVPWIAVFLTVFWVLVEATIFTYVTTPLVIDTLSNITGEQLSHNTIQFVLFIFMFFIVLGSYAVLSTFIGSVKSKSISQIIGIGVIEIIVMLVEVLFLYREFVDSLVPWFSLYADDFSIGIWQILAISTFVWFGIRSLSWFLFAEHGTPTIMSVIQGKGLPESSGNDAKGSSLNEVMVTGDGTMEAIKKDMDWVEEKGEELLAAFMLPPLQVIAASINFCTLLTSGSHLFELPLTDIDSIKPRSISKASNSAKSEASAGSGSAQATA